MLKLYFFEMRRLSKCVFQNEQFLVSQFVRSCCSSRIEETDLNGDVCESSNKFGTLSQIRSDFSRANFSDAPDEDEVDEIPIGRRPTTLQYANKIKALISSNKLKEAFDVVEVELVQQNKQKPCNYLMNLLIGACGRVGYTKKAFQLYNEMKSRNLKVTGGTYTALFNACANSPWSADGLTRALHLRTTMSEKGYEPNDSNYHAMIKAFGRCGDLETAFAIVDEMMDKRFPVKTEAFNFLLHGCVSDKESGFRHALLVWKRMLSKNIKPDRFSFALMLKCAQDCSTGDATLLKETIETILENATFSKQKQTAEPSDSLVQTISAETATSKNTCVDMAPSIGTPNLMLRKPHLGQVVEIGEIKEPKDRLLLIGGMNGFLSTMLSFGAQPDIKIMTQLLITAPNTVAAEKQLLELCKRHSVQLDLEFYNMLIKKRAFRHHYEAASDVLNMIKKARLKPDLITYGTLAIACSNRDEALQHIILMSEQGYRLNSEILGAMLRQACYHYDFLYVSLVLETSLVSNIRPSERFKSILSSFKKDCKQIVRSNKGKPKSFAVKYKKFCAEYDEWLKKTQTEKSDKDDHPWTQYRQKSDTYVKTALRSRVSHFKPRRQSYFKQPQHSAQHIKEIFPTDD